ncbi:hypothetical protein KKJ03_01975 [Xenorhabdus bovienii]|nr:hypothetical protein [Xenorhabdus bovienii]MDE9468444.1 hypothetical protein [Xenorhabdus bovienii]MDE9486022.1 hypothetical protein [Xenorhabdus bovienii]
MLGGSKLDRRFVLLAQKVNEVPDVSPDILGEMIYYSFYQSGILLLLESNILDQITFFIEPSEGFTGYIGELPEDIELKEKESEVIAAMGAPISSGGGKPDMLLGYINRWIKYIRDNYVLHIEFNKNSFISKLSLMLK